VINKHGLLNINI